MKIKYLKLKNWLMVTAMGLLGLSACRSGKDIAKDGDKDKDRKGYDTQVPVLMYGVPTTELIDSVAPFQQEDSAVTPSKPVVPPQPQKTASDMMSASSKQTSFFMI